MMEINEAKFSEKGFNGTWYLTEKLVIKYTTVGSWKVFNIICCKECNKCSRDTATAWKEEKLILSFLSFFLSLVLLLSSFPIPPLPSFDSTAPHLWALRELWKVDMIRAGHSDRAV
jgi:hypothetical protein